MLALYVNDHIIGGFTDEPFADVKTCFSATFEGKDLVVIHCRLLRQDIELVDYGITIAMETYIKEMIGACGLDGSDRETTTEMINTYKLLVVDPGEPLDDENATNFKSISEIFLFAAKRLRYNIRFVVGQWTKFLSKPHKIHLSCGKLINFRGSPLVVHYGTAR